MSTEEKVWRVKVKFRVGLETLGFFKLDVPLPDLDCQAPNWISPNNIHNTKAYILAANKIMGGKLHILNIVSNMPGPTQSWNKDPSSGKLAPLIYGKLLNYRNESLVGDIKYLWEPARHLHLVTIAQAYYLTKSPKYLSGIKQQVKSWIEQCPYALGPHWSSSLELSIRLINWSLVWQLIGGIQSPLFKGNNGVNFLSQWLISIYQHTNFIQENLSRHSSANNHLIGEAAGLYIATMNWPFWPAHLNWNAKARQILENEVSLQHSEDGVNREQAICYQHFVLDFLILSACVAKANNADFSGDFYIRIEESINFIASIMDVSGRIPMIGDSDDGLVFSLSQPKQENSFRSLLATGCLWFDRCDLAKKAIFFDAKNHWLLGDDAESRFYQMRNNDINLTPKREFPKGGYYILGDNFNTEQEIHIVLDTGPLGYLNIAAHGHADALSFTLSIRGLEFLIDPGTYTYHTQEKWRNYFRSTLAHNTVRVDESDQSTMAGNFMWKSKANARVEKWCTDSISDHLVASHDGYCRLSDPVTHKRSLQYFKDSKKILVKDYIICREKHSVEICWHFSNHCTVQAAHQTVTAMNGSTYINMRMVNNNCKPVIYSGRTTPPTGWISRRYGEKVPISTCLWAVTLEGTTELVTEISIHNDYN